LVKPIYRLIWDCGIDERTALSLINEILGDRINVTGYTPEIGDVDA